MAERSWYGGLLAGVSGPELFRFPVSLARWLVSQILELFAGIGGMHAAWPEAQTVAAYDINRVAANVYQDNFDSVDYRVRELQRVSLEELEACHADTWWMSPPCQPYCRLGGRRDLEDPRSLALLSLVEAIARCSPRHLVLENVVGFETSRSWTRLKAALDRGGYRLLTAALCPSKMGWPNRRPRFYLIASRGRISTWRELPSYKKRLASLIDPEQDRSQQPELCLSERQFRFLSGMDRVDRSDPLAVTACFTGAYGKSLLKAGSYLRVDDRYRRFAPREVARLLGYSDSFQFHGLTTRQQWRLLGQSLSLPVVRYVVSHLPHGPPPSLPHWGA
ncbi:MAG: DNA cytosine methyltransferase [bacterium]|nr:DNA cytosine methyltransferase [bacterium]